MNLPFRSFVALLPESFGRHGLLGKLDRMAEGAAVRNLLKIGLQSFERPRCTGAHHGVVESLVDGVTSHGPLERPIHLESALLFALDDYLSKEAGIFSAASHDGNRGGRDDERGTCPSQLSIQVIDLLLAELGAEEIGVAFCDAGNHSVVCHYVALLLKFIHTALAGVYIYIIALNRHKVKLAHKIIIMQTSHKNNFIIF